MNETEKKLIKLIAELTLEKDGEKLLQQEVLERFGMSRMNFNKRYSHLNGYIKGTQDIFALAGAISTKEDAFTEELAKKYKAKCEEFAKLAAEFDANLEAKIKLHITSLMINDKILHDANDIRSDLEKQAISLDELKRKLDEKELEVTRLKSAAYKARDEVKSVPHSYSEIEPNMTPVFENFRRTGDLDVLDDEKESAIEKLANKARQFLSANDVRVVLYIDCYLCRFKRFLSHHFQPLADSLVIRLPLYSREEINAFVEQLCTKRPIDVYVPICESEVTKKALRQFFMKHVPVPELEIADRSLVIPSYREGFDTITVFRVGIE